ncbi:MAG TPA: LAGLIDADG family homing endonuclease [Candidatus Angelobacter sp.]|nr:LAGLIDADG family homing endonuclease [Candidatus Angelobacter sp.]
MKKEHASLSKSIISYWTRGIHSPEGRLNQFVPKSTPELAYVYGAILSDWNLNVHGYNCELILAVKDHDFAEEFAECLARTLGRANQYKVRWHERKTRWVVQGTSILLYNFLNRDWRDLKAYVEHCDMCGSAFLRAFFDGEGSICGTKLAVCNSDLQLLFLAKSLLYQFGIGALGPYLTSRAGTVLKDPNTGRVYKRRKDVYTLQVRKCDLPRFAQDVGFTILRKDNRLWKCVSEMQPVACISNGSPIVRKGTLISEGRHHLPIDCHRYQRGTGGI